MESASIRKPEMLGHNMPPASPFDLISQKINDLYDEAKNFCDGEPINTQGQADAVGRLLNEIRAAEKEADALRKDEVKPYDDGKSEVQARYAPLIADTKAMRGKTVLAAEACKEALRPWLIKLDELKRAAAEAARKVAAEKAILAREAAQQAAADDLAAREAAEALIAEAKKAEAQASKAEKDTAKASGGAGRAVSLRTVKTPAIADLNAAVKYYWQTNRTDFEALVLRLAELDIRAGKGSIPGIEIKEERIAQ